jgi:hypothetical protein
VPSCFSGVREFPDSVIIANPTVKRGPIGFAAAAKLIYDQNFTQFATVFCQEMSYKENKRGHFINRFNKGWVHATYENQ